MTLDLQPIIVWITAALTIINFLTTVRQLMSGATKENTAKIENHEQKLVAIDLRLHGVENEFSHLPNRETTHRMELTMGEIMRRLEVQDAILAGKFEAMDERLKPIQAIGQRLQDVLIEQARNTA